MSFPMSDHLKSSSGASSGVNFDASGLPTISPAPYENKNDMNIQAYQQLLASANNTALQHQLLMLNQFAMNPLANPLANLSNPLVQAQLAAAGFIQNPMQQPGLGGLAAAHLNAAQLAALNQIAASKALQNPMLQGNPLTNSTNGSQQFAFPQNPTFDFGARSEEQRSRKRTARKRPLKATEDPQKPAQPLNREREKETGRFTTFKVQKTDNLDLQLKLDTQKDEVQKLREQIVRRDELVVQLQHQLQSLQEENARQRNTLNSLSEPDQLRLYQDARFIREFKARQQYLHEIEMAAQRRLAAILAVTEEAQQIASGNSTPAVSTPLSNTPNSNMKSLNNPNTPSSLDSKSLSSLPIPISDTLPADTPQSAASEEHDSIDSMTLSAMSPPASWLDDPWSHDIPKPFREKIDLTKIELRPVEPPPNLVEHARMEYWEGQRQWQQQQEVVQRHMAALGYTGPMQGPARMHAHAPPKHTPLPAYAEKIDLAEKVARLRKTNSSTQVNLIGEMGLNLSAMNGLMSSSQEPQDPMVTDDHFGVGDQLDFLRSPSGMDELDFLSHSS